MFSIALPLALYVCPPMWQRFVDSEIYKHGNVISFDAASVTRTLWEKYHGYIDEDADLLIFESHDYYMQFVMDWE